MNLHAEPPYYRHLRGYALDPGFSTQLSTMTINEVNYKVLWKVSIPVRLESIWKSLAGRHNSTLKDALEKMNSDELVAMIPVDKTDPNITKPGGWRMPAENLYKRLKEKTNYRVLRMDDGFADECHPKRNGKAKSGWGKVKNVARDGGLFVEYVVEYVNHSYRAID